MTRQAMEKPAAPPPWRDEATLRVGISSCLLGQEVRWDGGHKQDRFLTSVLGDYVEWVPMCPEFEVGMGIPREPVRLVTDNGRVRMLGVKSGEDWTARMCGWAEHRAAELKKMDLCGFILKKDSPSCGMERVKLYNPKGGSRKDGRGLFAEALMRHQTNLPVEEEGRLNDPMLRENFIERLFAYRRLRSLFEGRWSLGRLVDFHTRHKLQLLAHSPQAYTQLGRLVANAKTVPRPKLRTDYEAGFMGALLKRAPRRRHVNVLQHCFGYLRKQLDTPAREEMLGILEDYAAGLLPLIVPVTMVRHYVRVLEIDYLEGQVYLEPHPKELMLRNHV